MPLLARLSATAAETLLSRGSPRRFPRDHTVYFQGDPASALYVIQSGLVAIEVSDATGHTGIVDLFGAGDCFGLVELLGAGSTRMSSARPVHETQAMLVPAKAFAEIRRHVPEIDRCLMDEMVSRVQRLTELLLAAQREDTLHRCLQRLVELVPDDSQGPVELHLTQSDLSSWVGASRPAVNHVLHRLQDRGLVSLGRSRIVITNVGALQSAVG